MELYTQREVQFTGDDLICRESAAGKFAMAIIFFAVAVCFAIAAYFHKVHWLLALFSGGFLALFSFSSFRMARRTSLPSNWILAINSDRVLIKFRSYLNNHFPEHEPHILLLPLTEIESVRTAGLKLTTAQPRTSGVVTRQKFLEITVRDGIDLTSLRARLAQERQPLAKRHWKHFPVTISDDRTIRLEWSSPAGRVVPSLETVIEIFSRKVRIAEAAKMDVELSRFREMPAEEVDKHLRQMAERGEIIRAQKAVMGLYRLSLTEANEYVRRLLDDQKK